MSRATFVYRLNVTYPDGSVYDPENQHGFRWPRARLFLSQTSAQRRAQLLRSFGATVTVERSQPVAWEDTPGDNNGGV